MPESTIETIRTRNNMTDRAVDSAESGIPLQPAARPAAPPPAPAQPQITRGTTNPDNSLPSQAFHAVKKFFGVADN